MVAPRKRGGKAQVAKAKAAQAEAEQVPEVEMSESTEDNGVEQEEEAGDATEATEEAAEDQAQGETEAGDAEPAEGTNEAEEKKEEPVESGKILVENVPRSYIFDYQEKLKEFFSKHGEVTSVKRGPIVITEQTTTPTLSAIVEFKNKDSLEKALNENGTVLEGSTLAVSAEARADTSVLVGLPYEASADYVRLLFGECGDVAQVAEFSKTKYKILRVTFQAKESVEQALKLDRELRINGFLCTVARYQEDGEGKNSANKNNKRQHSQNQNQNNQNRVQNANANLNVNNAPPPRNNNFRGGRGGVFNARGNFRGGRGRGGFPARGGAFPPRGGFAGINSFMPPAPYMQRPGGFMNDGQRPNKRLRQM